MHNLDSTTEVKHQIGAEKQRKTIFSIKRKRDLRNKNRVKIILTENTLNL